MNKVIAIAALTALAGSAFAQLSPLPPSSILDGVVVNNIGVNAGAANWEDPTDLKAYKFESDDNLGVPNPGTPDNVLGLMWGSSSLMALDLRNKVNAEGGTIRAIFLGESAGWLNDFGYTRSGNPAGAGSYSVFNDIQSVSPANIFFGQYIDIKFAIGGAANFDFWLNGSNSFNTTNTAFGGGVYTAFNPSNSVPYNAPGNVSWTIKPILVNTYINATIGYAEVPTFLVGFEDLNPSNGWFDNDQNDFMFAVQFLKSDGTPFTPVPEPSTYGLIGAVALLGLVAHRRLKAKKA